MAGTRANAAGRGGGRGGGQGEAVGRGQSRGSARGRGGGGSRGGARGRGGGPKSRLADSDSGEGGGAEQPEDEDLEDEERSSSSDDDDNLGRFEAVAMVERRGVATRDEQDTVEGGLFSHPPERERTDAAAMANFVASDTFNLSIFGMTQAEITQGINDGDLPHGKAGLYPSSIDRLKERFAAVEAPFQQPRFPPVPVHEGQNLRKLRRCCLRPLARRCRFRHSLPRLVLVEDQRNAGERPHRHPPVPAPDLAWCRWRNDTDFVPFLED